MQDAVHEPGGRLGAEHYAALYDESRSLEEALEQVYEATVRAYEKAARARASSLMTEHLAHLAELALVQEEQLFAQREHTQLLAQLYLDACR